MMPVAGLEIVMLAPATDEPLLSFIVPLIDPDVPFVTVRSKIAGPRMPFGPR